MVIYILLEHHQIIILNLIEFAIIDQNLSSVDFSSVMNVS